MKNHCRFVENMVLALLLLPAMVWGQDTEILDKKAENGTAGNGAPIHREFTLGAWYLGDNSNRFGQYSGLAEKGGYVLADFLVEKRPEPKSDDTTRWRIQGWRLGQDSRRLEFDYRQQGKQRFKAVFREIPNRRFDDGLTPFRRESTGAWNLPASWQIIPNSSTTGGFINLQENLVRMTVDARRQRLDLSWSRKLGDIWSFDVDFRHENKKGERSLGSIFGYNFTNPRGMILPAPVDWTTDMLEAMFSYATPRLQFSAGMYASFFGNDESTLIFQNPFGRQSQWAGGVNYPDSQGLIVLEPDNRYLQFRANGGVNFNSLTRLTANFSWGRMKQDDPFLSYTINPDLAVSIPLPLASLDARVDTLMFNARLSSRLGRRLRLVIRYDYDDRDNRTQRAIFPYVGGDAQNQRSLEEGRINRPYSYTRNKTDALFVFRITRGVRLKAGVEYLDYRRDYQEVEDSNEFVWLAGLSLRGWSMASLSLSYKNSHRDVSAYDGSVPLVVSSVPDSVDEGDWQNHPLLRKYFLTDRDREEYLLRADLFPNARINLGFAASYFRDDYDVGFFGLNQAKIQSWTVDGSWHPAEQVALTGFYTREKYDAYQSSRYIFNVASIDDPLENWFADSNDRVDTWNLALKFTDLGATRGWKGVDFGMDYTWSDTRSAIDVTAAVRETLPLPDLRNRMQSFSMWGSFALGECSSIRLTAENARLKSQDWALDFVEPDTLPWVLLPGQSAARYDLWLISASWSYQF